VAERMFRSWAQLVDEEKMEFDSPEAEQAMRQQAADLVRAYLAYAPNFEKPLAVEVAAEAPLVDPVTGEDLGMPLVGIIDLVLDYEEGPLITDFKTAARSSEPMEITHEIQLSSYAYLFRQASRWPESRLEIRSLIKTKAPYPTNKNPGFAGVVPPCPPQADTWPVRCQFRGHLAAVPIGR
jgi:ATP-dependent exoDNAse (exonuclease V) beta subunit